MSSDNFKLVSDYSLSDYPCGLTEGDKLQLKTELVCKDHAGTTTGKTFSAHDTWTVLPGVPDEPKVIWLRDPSGERHTWDEDLFDHFNKID
ncbi:MAG: hypothetical protein AAFY98_09960 [Verrucomicrobiota bacterium]